MTQGQKSSPIKKTTVAIFADVHSNLHALSAVLDDIYARQPDYIFCAGDLVGYGPYPNETVELIKKHNIPTVMGNYDDAIAFSRIVCGCDYKTPRAQEIGEQSIMFSKDQTSPENKNFLSALPLFLFLKTTSESAIMQKHLPNWTCQLEKPTTEHNEIINTEIKPTDGSRLMLLVHGSPRKLNEYLKADTPIETFHNIASIIPADILVYGHTHQSYHKYINGVHFINVGSAGKPKQGNPNVNYAWLEIGDNVEVDFIEVSYDKEATISAMTHYNLPQELINIIATGIDS